MNEEHLLLIEDCETREQQLSNWERGFIDSLRRQLENGSELNESNSPTNPVIAPGVASRQHLL